MTIIDELYDMLGNIDDALCVISSRAQDAISYNEYRNADEREHINYIISKCDRIATALRLG